MKVRTSLTRLLASRVLWTLLGFEHKRMILKFFPSMTVEAFLLIRAAYLIVRDERVRVPPLTRDGFVRRGAGRTAVRFASVVLPVMRVHTHAFIVVDIVEGTPHCLVVEDIEIDVLIVVVNELRLDVRFGVREGTEDAVLAHIAVFRVVRAELRLVFISAVQLLHFVVGLPTVVAH